MTKLSNTPSLPTSTVKIWLAEPLLHFAIIATVIFICFALLNPADDKVLEISQREIDARVFLAEMASGEELTQEQIGTITGDYIEEQVLVTEAKIQNLDNDTRIHNILAQKLRHVLSGQIIQPADTELLTFYSENASRYTSVATVSVDELVLNRREELPAPIIAALNSSLESNEILNLEAGSAARLPRVSQTDLSNIFNAAFAEDVFTADSGDWSGPYLSNRGQHWLKVIERSPGHQPQLSEITDLVRLDWVAAEEDLRLNAQVEALVSGYTVVLVNDSE